jgi:hypothetical protein
MRLPRLSFALAGILFACGDLPSSHPGDAASSGPDGVTDGNGNGDGADGAEATDGGAGEPGENVQDASNPPFDAPFDTEFPPGDGAGHVVFRMPEGKWDRVEATAGAKVEDIDTRLDAVSAGKDNAVSLSPDGAWLVLSTTRFGCPGDCIATVGLTGGATSLVKVGGAPLGTSGRPVIGPGGTLIVYPAPGGPHATDLYAITKTGAEWSTPVLLTAKSPADFQHDVAIAPDGSRVLFDCGPTPYEAKGGAICEAFTNGGGARRVFGAEDGPDASVSNEVHHAAYAPDGTIVFEADWGGSEAIWRRGAGAPVRISPSDVNDDNSPCVLPDGRIVSLWLGRPGNPDAFHEMKVMSPDGSNGVMVVTGVDLVDVGQSCGR